MDKKKPAELWRLGNTLTREQLIRRFEAIKQMDDITERKKEKINILIDDLKKGKTKTLSFNQLISLYKVR